MEGQRETGVALFNYVENSPFAMKRFCIGITVSFALLFATSGTPLGAQQPVDPTTVEKPMEPLYQLRQTGVIGAVAVAPNGKILAVQVGGNEQENKASTLALWNLEDGQLLRSWNAQATSLAWAPDGKTLAAARNAEIILWNAQGEKQKVLQGPAISSRALEFSPDGKTLAVGGSRKLGKGELWIWNLAAGEKNVVSLEAATSVDTLAFSPDSTLLAAPKETGHFDQLPEIGVWEVASLHSVATLSDQNTKGWINGLAFSPDGKTLISTHQGRQIVTWDIGTQKLQSVLIAYKPAEFGPPNNARNVAFSSDGKFLITTSNTWNDMGEGGELWLWGWPSRPMKRSILPVEYPAISQLSVATKAPIIAGASNLGETIWVWRLP